MRQIKIRNNIIGDGRPVFVIAEAGVNHNGSFVLAKKLIDVAARAGADAVKFQTFSPAKLTVRSAAQAEYQKKNTGRKESQLKMLERLALPRAVWPRLKKYAESKGLVFLSTPFSFDDAEFLHQLGVPAFKVGSGDANNTPYLTAIARKKLPIILSTGMSTMIEARASVDAIRAAGNNDIIVLHCTTSYPTPDSDANLRAMTALRDNLEVLTGYSDHTMGIEAPMAAVALGACVIEKHFTLDRSMSGPDHKASLEPEELAAMVDGIRKVEKLLGSSEKHPTPGEARIAKVARKSIVAGRFISKGTVITADMLEYKRPGTGIPPSAVGLVVTKVAKKNFVPDELIALKFLKDI